MASADPSLRPPSEQRPAGRRAAIGLAAILLAGGIAAYFLLGIEPPPEDRTGETADRSEMPTATAHPRPPSAASESSAPPETLPEAVEPAAQAVREAPPPAFPEEPSTPITRGDDARDVIAELRAQGDSPDFGAAFTRAQEFQASGRFADAHLLYFFAARRGHTPSAVALGAFYDPRFHKADASIVAESDAGQAHKWYSVAAQAGDAAAIDRVEQLRAHVEGLAAEGDQEAKRLLLQWR